VYYRRQPDIPPGSYWLGFRQWAPDYLPYPGPYEKSDLKRNGKMRNPRWLRWLGGALIAGGAAFLGSYYWMQQATGRAQHDAQEWLNRTSANRRAHLNAPNPPRPRLKQGAVLGRLSISRLNLAVMVFEGDDAAILERGAGHIPATSLPDQSGNFGIAAHRDTYFRPLRLIRPYDVVEFTTPEGVSRYSVTDIEIVRPSDIQVLARAPGRDLTLVTCYPFFYLGSAPKRWIVHAKRI
jgi:sortase A